MMHYGPITACQVCSTDDLRSVLFLGFLPPVNAMRPLHAPADKEYWFPAEVLYCPHCHLVQLGYAGDPAIIFPPAYPYTSGSTKILRDNFADLYRETRAMVNLADDDLIVDIGSNDGTLLSNFHQGGHRVLGIEPTRAGKLALERGIPTLMSFFDAEAVRKTIETHGHPKVVTAANVFAHIHRIHDVVRGIETLLGDDGIFVSESHYLKGLLDTVQYDTIYHEHLRYYSLTSLKYLLEDHGFRVFHVARIPTHGGSIRVYASRSDAFPVRDSVDGMLHEEDLAGLNSDRWIMKFRQQVLHAKLQLYVLISELKERGASIFGIGAPSRASTLINYVGLDDGIVDCVMEISTSKKLDKYIPGRRIPVLDEKKLYEEQPEYALLLSWHIADELCKNLKRRGYRGDFIIPLPEPTILKNGDVQVADSSSSRPTQ